MPSYALTMPFRPAFDGNALPIAGAKAVLTFTGTTTLAPVYTDTALTIAAANPVVANAAGRFPRRYLNNASTYRLRIFDADDDITVATPLEDFDPYVPQEVGALGPTGPTGAAGVSVTVGTTTTGAAGTNASVANVGTASNPILNFTIPRGDTGATSGATWGSITGTLSTQADLQAALDAKAALASPALTGNPTAPTAAVGDSDTSIATTAFVQAARDPRIQSVASSATVTPTYSNDLVDITAQAEALTLANWSGTAVDGHGCVIRIKDNGTARAIAYGTEYRAVGVTLPATTVINKTLYLGCIRNSGATKLDVVSVRQEA